MTEGTKDAIIGPSKVLSHVFIGSQKDAKAKSTLVDLGITHILNCTPSKNIDPVAGCPNFFEKEQDSRFIYKRIALFDNAGESILEHIDAAISFIENAKYHGSVLVHCKKGVSRSASFVIAYLMKMNEFTFEEAIEYVQSKRSIVSPNKAFIEQLKQYEKNITTDKEIAYSFDDTCSPQPYSAPTVCGPMAPPVVEVDSSSAAIGDEAELRCAHRSNNIIESEKKTALIVQDEESLPKKRLKLS